MAQFEFKSLTNVRQKDKDIVNGFVKEVQILFPKNNPYYNIPDLIKHLCLLYFHHVIPSKLLTKEEQSILMKLLRDHKKSELYDKYEWKLIYRASRDGLNEDIAKKYYENKKNLVAFIHTKNDNIFGGYTSSGWKHANGYDYVYNPDKNAFIFGIRSSKDYKPSIRNVLSNTSSISNAMFSRKGYYLIWNYAIYIHGTNHTADVYGGSIYEPYSSSHHLTGGLGPGHAKIKDIELFQLL